MSAWGWRDASVIALIVFLAVLSYACLFSEHRRVKRQLRELLRPHDPCADRNHYNFKWTRK